MLIFFSKILESNHKPLIEKYYWSAGAEFQKKFDSFRRWEDAQLFLLGRMLLFKGVKVLNGHNITNENVYYSNYGKPFINDKLFFNISHSGEFVVCVINKNLEVGIDIECINKIDIDDYQFQMTDLERKLILNAPDKLKSFYYYWTQKEAVIKAVGKGFYMQLNSFEVIDDTTLINDICYYTYPVKIHKDYCCYLAINSKIRRDEIRVEEIFI